MISLLVIISFTSTGTTVHEMGSRQNYANCIHELAHAAHWGFDKKNYNDSPAIVYESYARGIELYLTQQVYPTYSMTYWRRSYTGMMRDLTDGYKTVTTASYRESGYDDPVSIRREYYDRVSGYTIREIEDALIGCKTWDAWRNRVKSLYPNKKDRQYVDEVFNYWNLK